MSNSESYHDLVTLSGVEGRPRRAYRPFDSAQGDGGFLLAGHSY